MLLKKVKKKKKIPNYIATVPATHRLKVGQKIHVFKTRPHVHEYFIYLSVTTDLGTCVLA